MKYKLNYSANVARLPGTTFTTSIAMVRQQAISRDTHAGSYNRFADKVGCVPNIRMKDNLYQGLAVAAFFLIGVVGGGARYGWPLGAMAGAVAGLAIGGVLSGLALMFVGLARKS